MRSPPSRTRSITNCPGLADDAISGASMRKSFVTGVRRRVSRMRAMSQLRVRVHRLEPEPSAIHFGLNAPHGVGIFRPEQVACLLSLIHISEPTRLLSISYAVFCLKK